MSNVIRFGLFWILAASAAQANVYTVAQDGSGDFTNIQAAIVAAGSGDEIRVEPGTYYENLDYLGKNLNVHSTSGSEVTVIDGSAGAADHGSCLVLQSGETQSSVCEGFGLRNGHGTHRDPFGVNVGGAILLYGSSLTLRNCRIEGNAAVNGGALFFYGGGATITDCAFLGNTASTYGGAVSGSSGSLAISSCLFADNLAQSGDGTISLAGSAIASIAASTFRGNRAHAGAGLNVGQATATANVYQCRFEENSATGTHGGAVRVHEGTVHLDECLFLANSAAFDGGGVILLDGAEGTLDRCTLFANEALRYGGQVAVYSATLQVRQTILTQGTGPIGGVFCDSWPPSFYCSDTFGNAGANFAGMPDPAGVNGNISLDPQFCDASADDFHLMASSPCAPHTPPNPECDLIGALPVQCDATPVESTTWGRIKREFHR